MKIYDGKIFFVIIFFKNKTPKLKTIQLCSHFGLKIKKLICSDT